MRFFSEQRVSQLTVGVDCPAPAFAQRRNQLTQSKLGSNLGPIVAR